jgi:hypothetical protein
MPSRIKPAFMKTAIEAPHYHDYSGDYGAPQKRRLPSTMTDPKRVEAYLNKILENELPETSIHPGVSTFRLQILQEAYKRAMADPNVIGQAKCKNRACGNSFDIVCTCPSCGEVQAVNIPSSEILKSKTVTLNKLIDKIAPNLQNTTHQVDIQYSINKVSTALISVVMRYVPETSHSEVMALLQSELSNYIAASEMEILPNDVSRGITNRCAEADGIETGLDSDSEQG